MLKELVSIEILKILGLINIVPNEYVIISKK